MGVNDQLWRTQVKKRHPENPNLQYHHQDSFKGLPVMSEYLPMISNYLETLHSVIECALQEYTRVFIFRVEPVIPWEINDRMTAEDHKRVISKFLASFREIIDQDYQRRRRHKWIAATKVRYVWCREMFRSGRPHYHFMFILNQEAFNTVGNIASGRENLAARISRAWHSALGLTWDRNKPLIHLPKNSQYWISRNDRAGLHEAFRRLSYLCKSATKRYGDGMRSFGASRS